jgi:hypothetical protein
VSYDPVAVCIRNYFQFSLPFTMQQYQDLKLNSIKIVHQVSTIAVACQAQQFPPHTEPDDGRAGRNMSCRDEFEKDLILNPEQIA